MLLKPIVYSTLLVLAQLSNLAAAVDETTTTDVAAAAAAAAEDATTTTAAAAAAAATTATTATTAAANAATTATTNTAATAATTATTATTAVANAATTATTGTAATTATTATTPTTAAAANAATTATTADTDITALTTGTTTGTGTDTTTTAAAAAAATTTTGTGTNTGTTTTGTGTDTDTSSTTTGAATTPTTDTTTTAAAAAAATTDTDTTSTLSSSSSSESASASASESASSESDSDTTSDSIVGTWSSKSNTVFTGPGFYDPVDELLIEPALPGISYSFTEDGFWEEAIYQVSPNPKNHSCATAVLIFQHGTYEKLDNGSLVLTPFEVDGRQLLSMPCDDNGVSTYSRYNQTEGFNAYQVYVDGYHGRWRIDLIETDGSYMQPLYLAYDPPQMLPTITMNPTSSAGNSTATSSATAIYSSDSKLNRRELGLDLSLSERIQRSLENRYKTNAIKKETFNYSFWWWTSATMMGLGAVMFVMS